MAQWFAIKADHQDALLFFRMGDFYELFFEDAQAAAAALDIALTARGSHAGAPIAMCGVPVSQAEMYLARLIRRGFRVAIVEQMEEASAARARGAKGPLRREVVRLVTPGTLTEESLLEGGKSNFLAAVAEIAGVLGVAWLDISTGIFETQSLAQAELQAVLGRVEPAEIFAPETADLGPFTPRRVTGAGLAIRLPPNPAA
jgi:DNA mismatch repair protein MutS